MSSKPLDVAIVGGGIVGVCLAIGLHKLSHLNVQLYESAPDFGEIGKLRSDNPQYLNVLELQHNDSVPRRCRHSSGTQRIESHAEH